MEHFWFSYWWLIFPVGAFLFGAWDRWLSYRRSRDTLDLMKTYSAQGREPPPELLRKVQEEIEDDLPPRYDVDPRFYGRRARRAYRRYYRWGPYGQWRAAVITGAVAGGFWMASEAGYVPGAIGPFRFVAVILTCVAAANLALAILGTAFRRPDRD